MTPTDLHAFGNRRQVRAPRPLEDFGAADLADEVGPEPAPLPRGGSTFGNVAYAPLTGHYHRLLAGTELPEGLGVVADGADIVPNSPHPPTHHTIYPIMTMTIQEFIGKFMNLPWQYAGKK